MEKKLIFFSTLLFFLVAMPMRATRPFYDSKSWVVNVAGDYEFLEKAGFKSKIYPMENLKVPAELDGIPTPFRGDSIARILTEKGFGKTYIDALTGGGKDDILLRKLALNNATKQDLEFGAENLRAEGDEGLATLIADDYEPILRQNYIILTYRHCFKDKKGEETCWVYYAIFQVKVSKEEAFDIVANIGTDNYDKLSFPIEYLYGNGYTEDTESDIATAVPALAVRGVLTQRNPCKISIGSNAGIAKGDLISFYRQYVDKQGNPYSKRISRARVSGVWDDTAQVNFEANTMGDRKKGDVAVRTPDNHTRSGFAVTYTPHVWGGQIISDSKVGFTRSGIIHHTILNLGFSMTDHPGDKFAILASEYSNRLYKSPMYANLGIGYGLSKTFLGFFDVMPFFLVQYEAQMMMKSDVLKEDDGKGMVFGSSVRVPIGVRFSFNIGYPCRIFVEGGYSPRFGFGDEYKYVKQAEKWLGVKRDGIFVNLGLIF